MRTYAYRLYPSKTQTRLLESTVETCRHFYNDLLAERKDAYESENRTVGKMAQMRHVKTRKAENPYCANVHSHILQVVVSDLDKAFQAFFRRVKTGEAPGYPRFKGRYRFDSFGLKEYRNGWRVDGRRLKITGIGRVAVRWHRPLEGVPKTLRVIRKADGWYACIVCDTEPNPLPATGQSIGVDVGLSSLMSFSDGTRVENPLWYRAGQKRLRRLQRSVSRKQKGGANRRKAVARLQRQHQRIKNQRGDALNKIVHRLIVGNDTIAVETLRIRNMVRNRHLAKSISDAGWGYFIQRLHAKAEEAGRVVIGVDPAYTSQTCSGCGTRFDPPLTLAKRWVRCSCGMSLDSDHNAAINILNRAGHVRCGTTVAMAAVPQEAAGL